MPISLLATEILFNLKTIWKYGMSLGQITGSVKHKESHKTVAVEVKAALAELKRMEFIELRKGLYFSKE